MNLVSMKALGLVAAAVVRLAPGPDLPVRLQAAVIDARPGETIELPAGKFEFADELVIRSDRLTVRGQGMDKTILSFAGQVNGAQGVLATGRALAFENFAIEDTPGDGLKLAGVDGASISGVRVEWTRGSRADNGSYGLYPVQSRGILIEDSVVRGASDAGIYVGQSEDIIVRRNLAERNVAGIEIENSHRADVYENTARGNTGGVLVFSLPNLPVRRSSHVRVFKNKILDNNLRNFAAPGNIVGNVPAGTGMMVMAADDVEVFANEITGQELAPVAVVNYRITEIPVTDASYDPTPRRVSFHDNSVRRKSGFHFHPGSRLNVLLNGLFLAQGESVADELYDGIDAAGLKDDDRICFADASARVANLQLDRPRRWWLPFPGGPVLEDRSAFACVHPAVAVAVLPAPKPAAVAPSPLRGKAAEAICSAKSPGVNWSALAAADCPKLSQYRLSGGTPYDLTTPLFSDYATKDRVVYVPPGRKIKYTADGPFDFPVGSVISKAFGFGTPERVVETRLLVRRKHGWAGLPYIWRDDRAEAELSLGGGAARVDFENAMGHRIDTRYAIPNANQCASCHATASGEMRPIGPKARLLNKDYSYAGKPENQLAHWARSGLLAGAPEPSRAPRLPRWDDPKDGTLDRRARAYLEVNCAHCHNPDGLARNTGLFLDAAIADKTQLGICKPPVAAGMAAAGLRFDVVPGRPERSILLYRMKSTHPKIKMPQLSRSVVHEEGVALISAWIQSLAGSCARD
jgi:parallel beta-helix repeat protein